MKPLTPDEDQANGARMAAFRDLAEQQQKLIAIAGQVNVLQMYVDLEQLKITIDVMAELLLDNKYTLENFWRAQAVKAHNVASDCRRNIIKAGQMSRLVRPN